MFRGDVPSSGVFDNPFGRGYGDDRPDENTSNTKQYVDEVLLRIHTKELNKAAPTLAGLTLFDSPETAQVFQPSFPGCSTTMRFFTTPSFVDRPELGNWSSKPICAFIVKPPHEILGDVNTFLAVNTDFARGRAVTCLANYAITLDKYPEFNPIRKIMAEKFIEKQFVMLSYAAKESGSRILFIGKSKNK